MTSITITTKKKEKKVSCYLRKSDTEQSLQNGGICS